jgi:hypothetical protein
MNERIGKLAEQAESAANEVFDFQGNGYYGIVMQKFAELIVQECARVYWNIDDGEIHGEYVKALKEHFGIEE